LITHAKSPKNLLTGIAMTKLNIDIKKNNKIIFFLENFFMTGRIFDLK